LALVLDVSDRALGAPIDRVGEVGCFALEPLATGGGAVEIGLGMVSHKTSSVAGTANLGGPEFGGGHVGELVDGDLVSLGGRIMGVDGVPVLGELVEGGGDFLHGMVDLLVLGDEI